MKAKSIPKYGYKLFMELVLLDLFSEQIQDIDFSESNTIILKKL